MLVSSRLYQECLDNLIDFSRSLYETITQEAMASFMETVKLDHMA